MGISAILPNQLAYFATVYRLRDVQAAADSIPMTLQGVRKAVWRLESDLGVHLFEPAEGSLKPTPFADRLYELVCNWNSDLAQLSCDFKELAGERRAMVSLGAALGVPGCLGIGFVRDFEAEHLGVHFDVAELPDYWVEGGLLDHEYDLALTIAPFNEAFTTVPLHSSPVTAWVNKEDPLSGCSSIEIDDLAGRCIGIVDKECKVYDTMRGEFERRGVTPPSMVTTTELFWLLEFAKRGEGIGISVEHVAKVLGCENRVASIPLAGLAWEFGISWRKGHQLAAPEQEFVSWLTSRSRAL